MVYRGRDSNSQGYSPADFESAASTNSATPAQGHCQRLIVGNSWIQVKPDIAIVLPSGFEPVHIREVAGTY